MPAFPFTPDDNAPLEELIAWGYDTVQDLVGTSPAMKEKGE